MTPADLEQSIRADMADLVPAHDLMPRAITRINEHVTDVSIRQGKEAADAKRSELVNAHMRLNWTVAQPYRQDEQSGWNGSKRRERAALAAAAARDEARRNDPRQRHAAALAAARQAELSHLGSPPR